MEKLDPDIIRIIRFTNKGGETGCICLLRLKFREDRPLVRILMNRKIVPDEPDLVLMRDTVERLENGRGFETEK